MTIGDRQALHTQALRSADRAVTALTPADLGRPSACAGWTNRILVEHMVGQNLGFAVAIAGGDAPADSYRPAPIERWCDSVAALREALHSPAAAIRLVEVAPERALPTDTVLGVHALDLAVHTWDLDQHYKPSPELTELVLAVARSISPRAATGGPFAPAKTPPSSADAWREALALLGRG